MKVKFFAHLQDLTQCGETEILSSEVLTGDQLWLALEKKFPGIMRYKSQTRLARNFTYMDEGCVFQEGDEIALIPPVSGG